MPNPEIEQFAKCLLREVRDQAIESCDTLLDREANNMIAMRWREKIEAGSPKELATLMIPDCVDQTLFYLLDAIDSEKLRISFTTDDGKVVDLTTEGLGELAGWFAGNEWKSKYSRQRYIDDFEDLKDFEF
jgi:hypothetical protein